jgi:prevent-host-death family protein
MTAAFAFIPQRALRNDNAEIIRRVEAGESFVVTRNGKPIADLTPHRPDPIDGPRPRLGAVQAAFRRLPPVDAERWRRDRDEADRAFGPDDPFEDPWARRVHE